MYCYECDEEVSSVAVEFHAKSSFHQDSVEKAEKDRRMEIIVPGRLLLAIERERKREARREGAPVSEKEIAVAMLWQGAKAMSGGRG